MQSTERKLRPIIGFAGLILAIVGLAVSCQPLAWGIGLLVPGTAMLVYSLFPGKLKFGG